MGGGRLAPSPMFGGDWYDADYWDHPAAGKSGFIRPYMWDHLGDHFQATAAHIVERFSPSSSLDVGCGKGFLVKALLDLGVDAYGLDLSEYAIQHCPPDVADRVRVDDITGPGLLEPVHLVTAFDVLEHLPEATIPHVLARLEGAGSEWLICNIGLADSPTPDPDASHINLQTRQWWLDTFNEHLPDWRLVDGYGAGCWWFNVPDMLFTLRRRPSPLVPE